MSEQQAYLRILVARLVKRFPVVLQMLAAGEVNLSTLKLLSPHLTADNHVVLLERARNKTKAEVEELVAEVAPKPDVPDRVRKLPERDSQQAPHESGQADMGSLFADVGRESVSSVTATQVSEAVAALHEVHAPSKQSAAVRAGSASTPAPTRESLKNPDPQWKLRVDRARLWHQAASS